MFMDTPPGCFARSHVAVREFSSGLSLDISPGRQRLDRKRGVQNGRRQTYVYIYAFLNSSLTSIVAEKCLPPPWH